MAIYSTVFGREYIHAEIIINGRPFAEAAEEYERLATQRGAGVEYCGFSYIYHYAEMLYGVLACGEVDDANARQKPLMICSGCHEPGCSGLWATIEETGTEVTWSGINNYHFLPGRAKFWRDYGVFPVYRFAKDDYAAALEQLRHIAREAGNFPDDG
jgi:hypothetical protein